MKTMNCSGAHLCMFLLLSPLLQAQQLKLGTAPNLIEKSALLDLNSDKQGLLLPRVSDYTAAPLSTAPDGMLIYYVPDKLLYIRKSGVWRKLIDETNAITSVNGQTTSIVSLTTNNIPESVNLYYTDARARAAFSAGTGISLSGTGIISALNTTALWNASQLQGRNISTNIPTNNDVLTWDNATSTWLPKSGTTGTVTSVALALPSIFTVSGSPVTTSGTLTGTLASQTQRQVFAAPVAANGVPSFRILDPLDIPSLDVAKITTGILPFARGGTGIGTIGTAGQLVRVNPGATAYEYFTPAYLTANQSISLTGDVTGSGTTSIATTLASVGTAGTYTKVTTDAKGRVISGTTLAAADLPSGSTNYIQNIATGTQTANFSISGNGKVGGTWGATGATTLGSTLNVSGATILSSTLNTTGATILGSTLNVTGATILSSTLNTTGATTLGSTLNVSAATTLSSTLNATGATTLGSTLGVTGNTTIGGTLSLTPMTTGSVLFTGASGLVSQNNANFFWDNTNNRLGIGTATPNNTLEVAGTTAATGMSGLRLKDLGLATVQTYNSKLLSIDGSGNVIVTNNPGASNWLITGNTGNAAGSFLGNTDDKSMVIKSNNVSFLEFGRRQTLGLVDSYPDYTDNDEKVTYVRSALQFEVPSTVGFYKPKMWTNSDGNFRMKGSSAGTDYFEFGATGTSNAGGFEFIVGDDGDEPIVFKSYNYTGPTLTEMLRLQSGNVGVNMAGATPARNLTVNGSFRFTGSVGISDKLVGRNNTDGDVATIGVGTTLTMSSNVLDANAASALWNSNKLQGVTLSSTAPASGQVLAYNGSAWTPAAANSNATSIQGVPVITTTPTTGQVLTYNGTNWVPQTPAAVGVGNSTATISVTAATTNLLAVGTTYFVRIVGATASYTINGISAGVDGQQLIIYNTCNVNMILSNLSGSAASANQIMTNNGATANTNTFGSMTLIYSGTDSKWMITAINQ